MVRSKGINNENIKEDDTYLEGFKYTEVNKNNIVKLFEDVLNNDQSIEDLLSDKSELAPLFP